MRDGAIGEVRAVHADFGLAGPFGPEHRLRDPAQGGGALLDLGVYPVSFAQLLLGEPADVQARARLSPEGVDVNTGHAARLGQRRGGAAELLAHRRHAADRSVTGTAGRIEFPRGFFHPERFVLHRRGAGAARSSPRWTSRASVSARGGGGDALPAGGRDASRRSCRWTGSLAVMRTLDAARTGSACATRRMTRRRLSPRRRSRRRGPCTGQTCRGPGFPASLTNDAAVVSGAPGVVTAETVR